MLLIGVAGCSDNIDQMRGYMSAFPTPTINGKIVEIKQFGDINVYTINSNVGLFKTTRVNKDTAYVSLKVVVK